MVTVFLVSGNLDFSGFQQVWLDYILSTPRPPKGRVLHLKLHENRVPPNMKMFFSSKNSVANLQSMIQSRVYLPSTPTDSPCNAGIQNFTSWHLHINRIVEPEDTISTKETVNTFRHTIGGASEMGFYPLGGSKVLRGIGNQYETRGFDGFNQCGDRILEKR